MRKRIASIVLSVCLCLTLLPTAAMAEGESNTAPTSKTLMLGTSGISGYDSTNGYDYIYYGTWDSSPIKWRVLDTKTNMDNAVDGDGLFLLSDVLLGIKYSGGVYFQKVYHEVGKNEGIGYKGSSHGDEDHAECKPANAWQGSDAQAWCKDFAGEDGAESDVTDAFTANELGAILATRKSDEAFTSSTKSTQFAASEKILDNDKIFFLSAEEAENENYGFANDTTRIANFDNSATNWWLRSPHKDYTLYASIVSEEGYVNGSTANLNYNMPRPAFNLNLNPVLFTSAAENGKSGTVGKFSEIDAYSGNDWKVTLKDSSREFAATVADKAVTVVKGDYSNWTVVLNYSNAKTGSNEYVSAILADQAETALYYGRFANNSESGTLNITIPAGLAEGEYTLNVFNEQYNGNYKTDYASAFQPVTLTVDNTAPTLTAGTASRASSTNAAVTFTSNEAGTYYYTVVDSGATASSIDTTSNGTACVKGENTISLTDLATAGARDIYIVAKDAAGNVSDTLTITIPAYVPPSSGSSDPTYSVTAPKADNGTIKVSPRYAEQGDTVSVTVTPDEGYLLDSLTVLDKNGKKIEVTDKGNGKYSFTMPKGKVTVEAVFVEDVAQLPSFADVPADAYYHDAVMWAAKKGITGGVDENHFAPNDPCSRAQLVTFLWRAAGQPEASGTSGMTDVSQNAYYASAVAWAFENGIVGGYGNGLFGSDDTITREQMAVILYRFAQATGMDTTQGGMSVREYKDYESVSDYAVTAIQWAVNAGIMQGNDGNLMPGQPCTRAQIVTMLYRLLGK